MSSANASSECEAAAPDAPTPSVMVIVCRGALVSSGRYWMCSADAESGAIRKCEALGYVAAEDCGSAGDADRDECREPALPTTLLHASADVTEFATDDVTGEDARAA